MEKLNKLFNLIGSDGCKHITISAILTVVGKLLLPLWVGMPTRIRNRNCQGNLRQGER